MTLDTDNQLLRDAAVFPDAFVIAAALGGANDTFIKFTNGLNDYGISLMGWRYYGDGKSWLNKGEYRYTTARGTEKVTPVFWLSVWDGFFKLSFYFSPKYRDELLSLPLSAETKQAITGPAASAVTARLMGVFLSVKNDELLKDAYIVSEFQKKLK
jgi:hypothetical protein